MSVVVGGVVSFCAALCGCCFVYLLGNCAACCLEAALFGWSSNKMIDLVFCLLM